MLAIDTNIIVRYLTGDHPEQSAKARELIDGGRVFVATTVLLEVEWVLRGARGCRAERLAAVLEAFAGLPNVTLESPARVRAALDDLAAGLDFADALHRAAAVDSEAFVTFDKTFASAARKTSGVAVRLA